MARVISAFNLKMLAKELATKTTVVAPVMAHSHSHASQIAFLRVGKNSEIVLRYPTTILPPKEFLLPPTEVLFEYENGKTKKPQPQKQVIFGVNLEDLEGIFLLEKIFAAPFSDEPFLNRFSNTILVAIDRYSPPENLEYDLYLMEYAPENYLGVARTPKGREILKSSLFSTKNIPTPKVKPKKDALLTRKDLPKIIEGSKEHPIWDELAEQCFGCGICSYTCPLCYCFETCDQKELGEEKGSRCRSWDSCMLKSFADTNAGNFRPELKDRIYNWYYHKFVRMPQEYGFTGCVGCNRCSIFCPAKINYQVVLKRLVNDYEKL
jgi:ferredoxin